MLLEHSVLLGTSSSFSDRQRARLRCIAEEQPAVIHAGEGTGRLKPGQQAKEGGVDDISGGQTHCADETDCRSWSDRTFREHEYINAVRDAADDQGTFRRGPVSKQKEGQGFPGDVSVEAVINAVTACKERSEAVVNPTLSTWFLYRADVEERSLIRSSDICDSVVACV